MEMISYVRRGLIAHTGSFGENHRTLAGEVRLISPGAGITHADINPGNRPAEYLEIWIAADPLGGKPKRQTAKFPRRPGQLVAVASGFPEDRDAMPLRANARVLAARLPAGVSVTYAPRPGRRVYAISVVGRIDVNHVPLGPRDGATIIYDPSSALRLSKRLKSSWSMSVEASERVIRWDSRLSGPGMFR